MSEAYRGDNPHDEPLLNEAQNAETAPSDPLPPQQEADASTSDASSFVFEDLTLGQALSLMIYRPLRVGQELWRVITDSDNPHEQQRPALYDDLPPIASEADYLVSASMPSTAQDWTNDNNEDTWLYKISTFLQIQREAFGMWLLLIFATAFALLAGSILRDAATDPVMRQDGDTGGAYFWLFLSFMMYGSYAAIRFQNWRRHVGDEDGALLDDQGELIQESLFDRASTEGEEVPPKGLMQRFFIWVERHAAALAMVPIALLMSYLAYTRNVVTDAEGEITGIVFTTFGFVMWVGAIAAWYIIFTVDFDSLYDKLRHWSWPSFQIPTLRLEWTHLILIVIVLVAAYFRLHQLDAVPSEMTSDHIEKLIDAVKVDNGIYAVFFENNGGREAFQMYTVAAIADWFDVGFNFRALKYATVIEGMLTVILSFWVVKTVIGRENAEQERLGNWLGLATAALIALSSWHVLLSRLGLRIVLTPLTVLLVTFFLVRALRYNHRADFVNMGVVLGIGTYFYQANRTLPILVVVAVGVAVVAALWRNPDRYRVVWTYSVNLAMASIVAIVAYLPMHHYSVEFEREFWNRAYGRIFGDSQFDCLDEDGAIAFCRPSYIDMIDLLGQKRYGPSGDMTGWQAFRENYEDAFTNFMYEGDGQWITNANGYPALDSRSAGLYMIGFLMWLGLAIARRDVALLVVPLGVLILLVPSALTIAPGLDENPSNTRLSGTLPFVFMMAALPLGLIATQSMRVGRFKMAYAIGTFAAFVLLFNSIATSNYEVYFEDYREGYDYSWRPYRDIAAPLADFAQGNGSFGNAFYVNYPHWLDHRVLGSVAGDLSWPNGLFEAPDVYSYILRNQGTDYELDPEQPLLFYIHPKDTDDIAWLAQNFPGGDFREVIVPGDTDFLVYQAPSGNEWLAAGITAESTRLGCIINCLPGPR